LEEAAMKTVIDLDTELVEAAASVLGTTTKKDTIHASLAATLEADRRRRERERLLVESLGTPDLSDPAVMAEAWR
jgi:Arc/MetJ family transcription regulator